jgi:hypothetical protein
LLCISFQILNAKLKYILGVLSCLTGDLDSNVVGANSIVGWVRVWNSVSIRGTSITQDLSFGFPLLAAIKGTKASISKRWCSTWHWDIGSIDTWGRLEGGGGKAISTVGTIGGSIAVGGSIEECWVSLSLGVDCSHKGEKNNLK